MRIPTFLWTAFLGAAIVSCGSSEPGQVIVVGGTGAPGGTGAGGTAPGGTGTSGTGTGPGAGTGDSGVVASNNAGGGGGGSGMCLPANVLSVFASCVGCHSDPPVGGSLAGLVTYADLKATAKEDPTKNEAQLSLSRMQNAASPMPPSGLPPAADVTTLQNWINSNYPTVACAGGGDGGSGASSSGGSSGGGSTSGGGSGGTNVFANASGYVLPNWLAPGWDGGIPRSHNAGQDCVGCHTSLQNVAPPQEPPPMFDFAGTVYDGSGHAVVGAEVRLLDATGSATSVYTDTAGNFHGGGGGRGGFTAPAHVGVRNASASQNMVEALLSTQQGPAINGGACNACHCTGAGCTIAPIHLP
jgi:hypothetical protein